MRYIWVQMQEDAVNCVPFWWCVRGILIGYVRAKPNPKCIPLIYINVYHNGETHSVVLKRYSFRSTNLWRNAHSNQRNVAVWKNECFVHVEWQRKSSIYHASNGYIFVGHCREDSLNLFSLSISSGFCASSMFPSLLPLFFIFSLSFNSSPFFLCLTLADVQIREKKTSVPEHLITDF